MVVISGYGADDFPGQTTVNDTHKHLRNCCYCYFYLSVKNLFPKTLIGLSPMK